MFEESGCLAISLYSIFFVIRPLTYIGGGCLRLCL